MERYRDQRRQQEIEQPMHHLLAEAQHRDEYRHLQQRQERVQRSPDPIALHERRPIVSSHMGPRADALSRVRDRIPSKLPPPQPTPQSRPPLPGRDTGSERHDQLYNSFTSSYDNSVVTGPTHTPPRSVGRSIYSSTKSPEAADPPSVTSRSHRQGMSTPRRVIFSKQLENYEKRIPQGHGPPTPTIPILRSASGNSLPQSAAVATPSDPQPPEVKSHRTRDDYSYSLKHSARDPTPRSSERRHRESRRKKTIADILAEQEPREQAQATMSTPRLASKATPKPVSSDPPLERYSMPLKSPRNLFSKMEQRAKVAEANQRQEKQRQRQQHHQSQPRDIYSSLEKIMEPEEQTKSYTSTMSILNSLAQQEWDMSALFPDFTPKAKKKQPKSPGARRLDIITERQDELPNTKARSNANSTFRAYKPEVEDHWDSPQGLPPTWQELLPSKSPTNAEEGQEVQLINKDSINNNRSPSNQRPKTRSRAWSTISRNTSWSTEKQEATSASKVPEPPNATVADQALPSYMELEEDTASNQGTELVPLPSSEVRPRDQVKTVSSKKRRENVGWGSLLRGAISSPSNASSQHLPVVTMSVQDVKANGTDDTSESDEIGYDNTKWDLFDTESNGGDEDDDFLIPTSTRKFPRIRKKGCMLFSLLTLAISISGASIFFLITQSSDVSEKKEPVTSFDQCISKKANVDQFSERYAQIRKVLLAQSMGESEMIDEPESTQRKALCWVADVDELQIAVDGSTIPALLQRYTMGVFYYSWVREDIWTESQGLIYTDFLSATHECDWDVVLCGTPETVTALLLADKSLNGPLPEEVGNLESLSFLELSLNKLTGSLPTTIGKLTLLDYFSIAFNTLSGSIPSQIGLLTKLEFVNMRSSQVQGTIPKELGDLLNLSTLLLEGNWLSGSIPGSLGNLVGAEQLSFRKNYLTGRVPDELCELREIQLTELKVDSWVDCDCCTL